MSVAGKWRVTMPTPIGTLRFVWDLADEGGAWRGHMSGDPPVGNSTLEGIRVDGNTVAFQTTVQSPMGALQVTFTGATAGDSLSGVCKSRFGDNQFSATRV